MKLYLSGQMTGIFDFNYSEFLRVEMKIKLRYGCHSRLTIVNPAKIGREFKDLFLKLYKREPEWADYMKADIQELVKCDGIVVFGDFLESRGSRLELKIAKELQMVTYKFIDDLNGTIQLLHVFDTIDFDVLGFGESELKWIDKVIG